MHKLMIGVMGPGEEATERIVLAAHELGKRLAHEGWIVLSGGRDARVMDAVSRGARSVGGITVGILPESDKRHASQAVEIAIVTGMGSARNNINILSSDFVVAVGMGVGTASEVALALKAGRPVVLLECPEEGVKFFQKLAPQTVVIAKSPEEVVGIIKRAHRHQ